MTDIVKEKYWVIRVPVSRSADNSVVF
jgi:hypothetical protein